MIYDRNTQINTLVARGELAMAYNVAMSHGYESDCQNIMRKIKGNGGTPVFCQQTGRIVQIHTFSEVQPA